MSGADLGIDGKGTVQETSLTATTQINTATAKQAQTFTMTTGVTAGQYLEMEVNGTTYTQAFDTSELITGGLLADQITNGTDNLTATFGTLVMTLTSTVNGADFSSTGMKERADGNSPSNLLTSETATSAMSIIDTAIARVDSYRNTLGAVANRLDHTVSNLMNRVENQSAANSRILDADYAVESANLAKAQVLQQAGTAMLAQANASGQGVLSLLK